MHTYAHACTLLHFNTGQTQHTPSASNSTHQFRHVALKEFGLPSSAKAHPSTHPRMSCPGQPTPKSPKFSRIKALNASNKVPPTTSCMAVSIGPAALVGCTPNQLNSTGAVEPA